MRLPTAFRLFVLLVGSAATAAAQCPPCQHNPPNCIHWSQIAPGSNGHTIGPGKIEFADGPSFTINGTLTIQGTLVFQCNMGVTLTCNRIEVQNGGRLEIGTPGARAVGPVVIRLAGAAPPVQPPQRTLEVQPGGTLELHGWTNGNTTCWTQLANHALPGVSSLDLALLAPMNWVNGNPDTVFDQTEQLTVQAMNGTIVDVQEGIQYFHHGE
jgi:hypothetical protein